MGKRISTGNSGFDRFWALYPRHDNKLAAQRKWATLNPSIELQEKIWAALAWQVQVWERRFTPHAKTYLHNARWEDEPPQVKPDARGHLPPCRTVTECNRKLEAEIAARKGTA